MIKKSIICLLLSSTIVACSSIDKVLPDRRKEYKYSQEIPPLEVPPDLTTSSIEEPVAFTGAQSGINSYSELMREKELARSGGEGEMPAVALAEAEKGGPFLEVAEGFPRAWRVIGKAISNIGVEIFDRNRSIGIFYVLLEPEEVAVSQEQKYDPTDDGEDDIGMLLSDFSFLLGDDQDAPTEQEYRVKLVEKNGVTQVRVLSNAGKPQSEGPGFLLLERIRDHIQGKDQSQGKEQENNGS